MIKKKEFVLNMVGQILVLIMNLAINFFLTPFVLDKIGDEAYGFIGLINNFVSYTTIATAALNSLAGRFITLAYHRNDKQEAEEYYSSVLFSNIILSGVILIISFFLALKIEAVLNVPSYLLKDVQIALLLSTANAAIMLISVVYSIASFIKNKLYLNSLVQMQGSFCRILTIVGSFFFLKAHMWYYALSALFSSVVILYLQVRITRRLCPEFGVRKEAIVFERVKTILKSGIWASVENINKLLQTGVDLLIANLYVSTLSVGVLSIAKTVPNVLIQLSSMIVMTFHPQLAKLYADDKKEDLLSEFKLTIKVLSLLMIVPLTGFIAFGSPFYSLWLLGRTESDIAQIQMISVLTLMPLLINSYVEGLYYANILANRIKESVLISLGFSIASVVTEIFLICSTNWNSLYIIAGTSSAYMLLRYFLVTPVYCATILKIKWFTFYPAMFRAMGISIILYGCYGIIARTVRINSWIGLIGVCGFAGVAGYILALMLLLNRIERNKLKQRFVKSIRRLCSAIF